MPISYDTSNATEIERFGKRLQYSTLRKTPGAQQLPAKYTRAANNGGARGLFGTLVERYYFGINPDNDSGQPDFPEAGVELKTHPSKRNRNGKVVAKERLVLGLINYHKDILTTFEESSLLRKNKLLMLICYLYEKDVPAVDLEIFLAQLIDFYKLPRVDQRIIEEDWLQIRKKIAEGKAHLLSGADTRYLEACTKGATSKNRTTQPNASELAKPRAYALKAGYMTALIRGTLEKNQVIKDVGEIELAGSFDAAILARFKPYIGRSVEEIADEVAPGLNRSAKNFFAILAKKMPETALGVPGSQAAEFGKANIVLKTVRLQRTDIPKEHMSFPIFRYVGEDSIVEQTWDSDSDESRSNFRALLENRRYLFVVYQYDQENVLRLSKVFFWAMPVEDIEKYVRPAWEETRRRILSGQADDLPGESFNHVCHVRPHARNAQDTLPTPHNGEQTKKSFWLDRHYIAKQIKNAAGIS